MNDRELNTLQKVETLAQSDPQFTPDELESLKKVIHLIRGFEALGSFASFIKTTVIWFGIIIGTFIAVRNGVVEFIINVMINR